MKEGSRLGRYRWKGVKVEGKEHLAIRPTSTTPTSPASNYLPIFSGFR
jgi:hypothetical protein